MPDAPKKFLSDCREKSPFLLDTPQEPLQSLLKPDDGTLATLVTPHEFEALADLPARPEGLADPLRNLPEQVSLRNPTRSVLDKFRRDGYVEEIMRTTQWDYVEREFVTKVQYRTWDSTKQIWFIFEKDLPTQSKWTSTTEGLGSEVSKVSQLTKSVYYEGWGAFQGEDFLKLGCEKLVELCPYDRGSVAYSEWFDGWLSGARWYWNNEVKVTENLELKKEEDITVC